MDRCSPASRPTATCLPGAGAGAVRVLRRASSKAATPSPAPALRAVARPSVCKRIPLVQVAGRPPVTRRPRRHARKVAVVTIGGFGFLSLGGIAVAAGMGVTGSSLGAGSATIAACQLTGSITPTYVLPATTGTSDVVDTGMGYSLMSVTLKGIHANCANKTVYVTIVDSNATTKVLGSGSAVIGAIATGSIGTVQVPLFPANGTFLPVGNTGASTAGANQVDVLIPN